MKHFDLPPSNIVLLQFEEIIEILIQNYQKHSDSYFSECELQYELYRLLKSSKKFDLSFDTNSGKNVGIIHPEYPSVNRVKLYKGKGYRVWFDIAILNPDFIKSNSYQTVLARDERDAKLWGENLLAVFEFKFFPKKRKNDISSVREDCLKLSICPEIKNRYVLVFSNYPPTLSELQMDKPSDIKLYWITPDKVEKLF